MLQALICNHKGLIIYLVLINTITFSVYALDKLRSVRGGFRIRITTLLFLALIGGSAGALIGMYALRHKTKKVYFTYTVPIMLAVQIFFVVKYLI